MLIVCYKDTLLKLKKNGDTLITRTEHPPPSEQEVWAEALTINMHTPTKENGESHDQVVLYPTFLLYKWVLSPHPLETFKGGIITVGPKPFD